MTHGREAERTRLAMVHTIEALVSAASNLLTFGVFFFTKHQFGWTLFQNFVLSAGLGAVYIVGALAAHSLSTRFGRRGPLTVIYSIIIVTTLIAAAHPTPTITTVVILIYAFVSSMTWPIIENLISAGVDDPHLLSRRLARYNIVWATVGSVVIALNGLIIEKWPAGVFLIPAGACAAALVLVMLGRIDPDGGGDAPKPHGDPEPTLARQRVVALWLSRISVPAMYLMIYALGAMLPSLAVIQPLRPAAQTAICSVWMIVRLAAFLVLGATAFWHTRPRLLLLAAATLLISLLMITLPDNLLIMVLGQVAFGAATGLIYAASLYFGMVLSEGSTEHGGYHEALIGLGMTLGPAVGAATQWSRPGDDRAAVAAIAGLIGLSVLLASFASLRLRPRAG
jgi:MFS family permease